MRASILLAVVVPCLIGLSTRAQEVMATESSDIREHWLRENAAEVRTVDWDDVNFDDLEAFGRAVGDASVVMLGEQTHGDGACFLAKARLIRYLHEKKGFDVLLFESGLWDMRRAHEAYQAGEPVESAHAHGLFGIWALSAQVRPLMDYARASHQTPSPLEIGGFDSQVTGSTWHEEYPGALAKFLESGGMTLSQEQREALNAIGEWIKNPKRACPLDAVVLLSEGEGALLPLFEREKDALAKAHPALEIDFQRRCVGNLLAFVSQLRGQMSGAQNLSSIRDITMGRNLVWLAQEYYRGRKVIVWAASMHNARDVTRINEGDPAFNYAGVETMGGEAAKALAARTYSVMFTAYSGRIGRPWSRASTVPKADDGSLDELLHRLGKPLLFVDFRATCSGAESNWGWLQAPLVARPLGYAPLRAVWPRHFDGVFHTDTMTPSSAIKRTSEPKVPDAPGK